MNNPKSKGGRPIIHGRTTKQSKEEKKALRELLKAMKDSLKSMFN
ncbi:MAG: hypothetical protein WCH62_07350 [Candidatus Omnitrophota bacterium]